jgi:hypothetical protein
MLEPWPAAIRAKQAKNQMTMVTSTSNMVTPRWRLS